MAHVGGNSLFRQLPSIGGVARGQQLDVRGSQIDGADVDLPFERALLVEQPAVAALNLRQHLVEAVDQDTHLVPAAVLDADGVVLVARDGLRRVGQAEHRSRNQALQPPRQHEGDRKGSGQDEGDDADEASQAVAEADQVRFEVDTADQLGIEPDRTHQPKRIVVEAERGARRAEDRG